MTKTLFDLAFHVCSKIRSILKENRTEEYILLRMWLKCFKALINYKYGYMPKPVATTKATRSYNKRSKLERAFLLQEDFMPWTGTSGF